MKTGLRLIRLTLGLFALGPAVGAQPEHGIAQEITDDLPETELPKKMHAVIADLLKQDARVAAPSEPEATLPPKADEKEILLLSAISVTAKKIPDLNLPRETKVEQFFRTGTIAEHVGPNITTKLWFSGGKGVMLSFSW